jgi:hypothetical protein
LGRRTNYGFEKRQKEIRRAKKKEQKREERRARKQRDAAGDDAETGGEGAAGPEPVEAEEKARGGSSER